jgi:hypothetical protein
VTKGATEERNALIEKAVDEVGLEKLLGVLERMNTRFRPVRTELSRHRSRHIDRNQARCGTRSGRARAADAHRDS